MLDFEQFYLNTKNLLYQYLYQHVKDSFETEDIAQEAYLVALEEWQILLEHPNPAGWLVQTAKNIMNGYHRHVFFRMESIDMHLHEDIPYEEPAFDLCLMEDFLGRVYGKKELPLAKRYFLEDNSIEDLSDELGMTKSSLKNRIYRLRLRMKSYIESGGTLW